MKAFLHSLVSCVAMCMTTAFVSAQEQIYINELMPSNIDGIMDDRYDFPDSWVEIYNASNKSVNLKGWYLSNDKDDLQLWQIPVDCTVPAKGYQLIYLDKEEKDLHANFRLDIKGETLYLTKPDGQTIVDKSNKFDKLSPNNAFGRTTDGGDKWGWFPEATPGASNNTSSHVNKDQIVPTVSFSQPGGVYDSSFQVSLSPSEENDQFQDAIYYTTDGSEPTLQSARYTETLTIDTTTILRARIIKEGYLKQNSDVASYIFPQRELTLPVISLVLDPDYLWDDMIGIYCDGKNGAYYYKQDRYVNWAQEWRRPVNVEYFVNNDEKINQLAEMRIMGGYSREKPQKSLAVYANKRFGTKRFDYPFFQEKTPLDDGYKSIILRNSGQDFNRSFIRDAVNQFLMSGKADIDYQAYQPAIVFMNGEYWGIHNIRERSNDDFVASNYDTEEIDMLENFDEIKVGDDKHFKEFYKLVTSGQFTYKELDAYMDIEESLNYFILETFISNRDWPHNNIVCWRKWDGGKWRWIVKDTDYSSDFGNTSWFNALEYVNNGTKTLNNIIKGCWGNEQFREQFIDRYTVYLGDIFYKDVTIAIIDSFANQISEEMKIARPRWDLTYEYWQTNITNMRNWMRVRPNYVYGHLQSQFNLEKPVPVTIGTTIENREALHINGITVYEPTFRGKFFGGRKMQIELSKSIAKDFKYWQITKYSDDQPVDYQLITDPVLSFQVDTLAQQYKIQAVIGNGIPTLRLENGTLEILSDIDNDNIAQLQSAIDPLLASATAIDMTQIHYTADLSLDELLAKANPNRLVYTDEPIEGTNIICGSSAATITLSDAYAFHCPKAFEAEQIQVIKHLSEAQTPISYAGLILPFSLEADELPTEWRVLTLSGNQWIKAEEIQANQPYLVRFGRSDQTIRLKATHKRIEATPEELSIEGEGIVCQGVYQPSTVYDAYFVHPEVQNDQVAGRLFVKQEEQTTHPFDLYLRAEEGLLPEQFPIGVGTVENEKISLHSSLQIRAEKNRVTVETDQAQTLSIYTPEGKLYRQVWITAGQNIIALPAGLYVIHKSMISTY